MPEELRFPCIEKLSLHRLRDSMGAGLEPVLGLLRYFPKLKLLILYSTRPIHRVTKNLIRLKDQAYADVLERYFLLYFRKFAT